MAKRKKPTPVRTISKIDGWSNFHVDDAWNPAKADGSRDLAVLVIAGRLQFADARGWTPIDEATAIAEVLRNPGHVYETSNGEWYYARGAATLSANVPPAQLTQLPYPVWHVRVKMDGVRAFSWEFEEASPTDSHAPLDTGRFPTTIL